MNSFWAGFWQAASVFDQNKLFKHTLSTFPYDSEPTIFKEKKSKLPLNLFEIVLVRKVAN